MRQWINLIKCVEKIPVLYVLWQVQLARYNDRRNVLAHFYDMKMLQNLDYMILLMYLYYTFLICCNYFFYFFINIVDFSFFWFKLICTYRLLSLLILEIKSLVLCVQFTNTWIDALTAWCGSCFLVVFFCDAGEFILHWLLSSHRNTLTDSFVLVKPCHCLQSCTSFRNFAVLLQIKHWEYSNAW